MNFMMMMHYLAAAADGGVSGELLLKIIGAIFSGVVLLLGGRFIGKRESVPVNLNNNPLNVATSENDPISRHEFNLHRSANESRFVAIETNQLRSQDNVERKHLELLATIERAAKVGVEGRVALWNELKPVAREVAALQATSNVSAELAKLSDTLIKLHTTNGRKTAGN